MLNVYLNLMTRMAPFSWCTKY